MNDLYIEEMNDDEYFEWVKNELESFFVMAKLRGWEVVERFPSKNEADIDFCDSDDDVQFFLTIYFGECKVRLMVYDKEKGGYIEVLKSEDIEKVKKELMKYI